MKHSTEDHIIPCGCQSVGECGHNTFAEQRALDALVIDFAQALKSKLARKSLEGKCGWDDPAWSKEDKLRQLRNHIDKGDMLDVVAFAMFIWNSE